MRTTASGLVGEPTAPVIADNPVGAKHGYASGRDHRIQWELYNVEEDPTSQLLSLADDDAFDTLAACWSRWVYWAGPRTDRTTPTRREMMSKPPRRANQNWSHKLQRPLAIDNGMKLTTLADARTAVLYVFGSVDARTGALDHAIRCCSRQQKTGERDDVAAVTDAIERVLRDRQLL